MNTTSKNIGRVQLRGKPQYGQRVEKPKKGKGSYKRNTKTREYHEKNYQNMS